MEIVTWVTEWLTLWVRSISDPRQFLEPGFLPTNEQLTTAVKFFVLTFLTANFIFLPELFGSRDRGTRIKIAATAQLPVIFLPIAFFVAHWPFRIFGGQADIAGSFVTFAYTGCPYVPLIALSTMIMISAIPLEYRLDILHPTKNVSTGFRVGQDPRTKYWIFFLFNFLTLGLLLYTVYICFNALAFVHNLSGGALIYAIAATVVLWCPLWWVSLVSANAIAE